MESLQSAVQLIQWNYWMAVIDLKDAYYSVPINPQHRKYLRFEFKDTLYEFTCLHLSQAAHWKAGEGW